MTHLFYISNWYHDQLHGYGFDEASANFQTTNFSGMGLGADRVLAEAQDGSGTNNANFATPPDGTSGRMQMYRFTGPTLDRDCGLDAEIVFHELTHGTSNRLVGNGAGLNWDPAAGMGEGWSDFYALSLLNGTNADAPDARYTSGSYATYKLSAGYLDNYVYGIRRFPYSTVNTVNPMTWADVDDVTNDMAGGMPVSPLNFNGNGGLEVHNSGEIWALSLWEVRSRIIADPAGANGDVPTGNATALQLVTDGLKMTPIDPGFIDARDALFDADCATNACANETSIWSAFADRGLGFGSEIPYNAVFGFLAGHIGVKESFQLPALYVADAQTDVSVDDSSSNNNGVVDAGESVLLQVDLTNPWRAASRSTVSATAVLSTSTPGVTVYNGGTATYGAIAPQATVGGTPYLISIDPSVACGSTIDFTLATTSELGVNATTFKVRVGEATGNGPVVTYTAGAGAPLAIAIPDNAPRGVSSTLAIADDLEIADLDLRINDVVHTWTGDLTALLRSPDGVGIDLMTLIGALAADSGDGNNITNMVIDDDVANTAANDMVQATNAAAPFTKSWLPAFNAPWTTLAGFPAPDPVGNLSRYDGRSSKGTWTLRVSDQAAGDTGTINSWSLLVTPVAYTCAAVSAAADVTGSKTVAGTFLPGSNVTYTIVLDNDGNAPAADNATDEFVDVLPAGLTLVSATASSGTALANVGTNTVTWNGALAPLGGSTTITIVGTLEADAVGVISNQGTINVDADGNGTNETVVLTDDPTVAGTANPTVFTVQGAELQITKSSGGDAVVAGETVNYTIEVTNAGATAATGATIADVLPAGITGATWTCSAVGTTCPAPSGSGNVNLVANVPAGATITIEVTGTVSAAVGSTLSNTATVTVAAGQVDTDPSNNTATDNDAVLAVAIFKDGFEG